MLKIRSLNVAYGGLKALNDVSLDVEEGQFVAVVGPNGAGKTTLFKTISGVVAPLSGEITYRGQDLLAVPAEERAMLGIAHVPEGRQVFASMTVMENLEMGALTKKGRARWHQLLPTIFELFPVLAERREQLAGTLSGGEQQMVAIGRGLASAPDLLMLDEPSMGLAPAVVDSIFDRVELIHREQGLTILLVEQRVAEALELCDRGYVLETGNMVLEGPHDTLVSNAQVRRAYLGM
ncbi:ABC transporter ATP-binding protein [Bradyrhizobium sp.]|uniref:ABC transporter ATP-binding protein n=1 Tax=Bradyrhizobium sp. TaxID=376 RepID=UPI0026200F38|nr:ABC transporter ATP-binding protein [Bradyrhizobium sp.]